MAWCKCPRVPRGQPPGMAADKCISVLEWFYIQENILHFHGRYLQQRTSLALDSKILILYLLPSKFKILGSNIQNIQPNEIKRTIISNTYEVIMYCYIRKNTCLAVSERLYIRLTMKNLIGREHSINSQKLVNLT